MTKPSPNASTPNTRYVMARIIVVSNRSDRDQVSGLPKKRTSFLDKDLGAALKKKLIRPKVSWEASLRSFSTLLCWTHSAESSRSSGLALFEGPSRRATVSFTMNSPRLISSATIGSKVKSALTRIWRRGVAYLVQASVGRPASPLHAPGIGH